MEVMQGSNSGQGKREVDQKSKRRLVELDALRGIAAICVVLYHYLCRYNEKFGHADVFLHDFSWGCMGVQVFFVLSGFVIYMSLERAKTPLDFAVLRAIRLYPTYWAGIILTCLAIWVFGGLDGWELKPWQVVANFSMFHFFALIPSVDGAYWSLGEELKFYCLMLLFKWLGQVERPFLICVCWLMVATGFSLMVANFETGIISKIAKAGYVFCGARHCFWFVCGIALYGIWKDIRDWQSYAILVIGGVFLLLFMSPAYQMMAPFVLLGFAAVVFFRPAFLRNKVFVFLGAISYPLYILHQNIGYMIIKQCYQWDLNGYLGVAIAIGASTLLAWLVHQFVEVPTGKRMRAAFRSWSENRALKLV